MDGVVGAAAEILVDADQILHRRNFRREDDLRAVEPDLLRARGGEQRRLDHRLAHHGARFERRRRLGVLVHQMREQFLVERAPVGADAHRLVVLDRGLDDGAELAVALLAEADVAGIDAVFVERLGAGRKFGEQLVADVVEVADDRGVDAHPQQPLLDVRHCCCGFVAIDGDAHDLGAGARQGGDLGHRRVDVGRIGIGHRLHDDRGAAADLHVADTHGYRLAPRLRARHFSHLGLHQAKRVPDRGQTVNAGPFTAAG